MLKFDHWTRKNFQGQNFCCLQSFNLLLISKPSYQLSRRAFWRHRRIFASLARGGSSAAAAALPQLITNLEKMVRMTSKFVWVILCINSVTPLSHQSFESLWLLMCRLVKIMSNGHPKSARFWCSKVCHGHPKSARFWCSKVSHDDWNWVIELWESHKLGFSENKIGRITVII